MTDRRPGTLRSAVFSVTVTVVVLVGLNALVELLEDEGVVQTHRVEDRMLYQEEAIFEKVGDRFRSTPYARDHMVNSSFAADKGSRWRMFLLGASFAQGTPYDCCESDGRESFGGISTWLRAQYGALFPSREVEVINVAAGGTSSHRVVEVARSVLPYQPDVLVVASCNNEGVLSPGTVAEQLHKLGGYRFLAKHLAPAPDPAERRYFTPQHPDAEAVRKQFQHNLEQVIELTREAGVPLLLATLPVNLRYRGFEPGPVIDDQRYASASGNCAEAVEAFHSGKLELGLARLEGCEGLPDIQSWKGIARLRMGQFEQGRSELEQLWGPCIAQGVTHYFGGRFAEAVEALESCGDAAEALRWSGLARFELGEAERARVELEQAAELNPRNRCRPSYNALIRELAAGAEHVHLLDLEAAAERASPLGLPGPELFVDYCHMNWRGYGLMAEELRAALQLAGSAPGWPVEGASLPLDVVAERQRLHPLPAPPGSPGPQTQ
tara:strand:- start:4528 stop:6012 length:1485 start_codon:yes stop_codon:yes gene_type:complete